MRVCEVCGKEADIHHIVHRSEGGLDLPFNHIYLCDEHHRGKKSPHGNKEIDMEYKRMLQGKLEKLLCKGYYSTKELLYLLEINKSKAKKLLKEIPLYKQGYKSKEIIYKLMGNRAYRIDLLGIEEFEYFLRSEA